MNQSAIYAGTFDPVTFGHLDVVERAARIFPRLILAVAAVSTKATMFSLEERLDIARASVRRFANVEVEGFDGLLVSYARAKAVRVLIRGLRAFSDFEFEFQMALTNRKLASDIETMFLMPSEEFSYVSSSTVRQIAELGGRVDEFAPEPSCRALRLKLGRAPAAE